MNINDLVYLHMFDLDVTLATATDLIAHRFGKIKAIKEVDMVSSKDKALMYEVELRIGSTVVVTTYDPTWSIITMEELKEKIEKVVIIEELKEHLLSQVDEYIKEQA